MPKTQVPIIDADGATRSINYWQDDQGNLTPLVVGPDGQPLSIQFPDGPLPQSTAVTEATLNTASTSQVEINNLEGFNLVTLIVTGTGLTSLAGVLASGRLGGAGEQELQILTADGSPLPGLMVTQPGVYHVDARGLSTIRIHRSSSSVQAIVRILASAALPPTPSGVMEFGLNRPQVISSSDGVIHGNFYALKALSSDVSLHEQIRFAPAFVGEPSAARAAGFTTADTLLKGDVIVGPFDRLQFGSGRVLAYRVLPVLPP